MPIYTCQNCNKDFKQKSHFEDHMKRKNPCKKTEIVTDETNNKHDLFNKYDLLIKKIEELENINKAFEKKNQEFEKEINKLKSVNMKTNNKINNKTIQNSNNNFIKADNNNSNSNNNITNLIVMTKAFGNENLDFIDDKISKKILSRGYQSLPEYIKCVHFNENIPENHNVYLPNWRDQSKSLVYDGNNWNLEQTSLVIDDFKNKGIEFIQEKYNKLCPTDSKDLIIIKKLERFLESYNIGEKDKMDMLNEDIKLVMYNKRKIPENTRKNIK